MARKRGHHRLKPEVSPVTYIILGVTFIILTLAIIFSVDTKNQRLTKTFDLGKNNYEVVTLKKLEKQIDKGSNVLVVFQVEQTDDASNNISPKSLLSELQLAYKDESYNTNIDAKVKKILFVTVLAKDFEKYYALREKYELVRNNAVMLTYFEEGKMVAELNYHKSHDDIHPGSTDPELVALRLNLQEFFDKLDQ